MTNSFEENIENLEKIVKELESSELPLQTAVEKYTEAMELICKCETELKETKQKIQILSDEGTLKDFESEK